MVFKLGIICGGPSLERGISLNSARSVMDHLHHAEILIYYINQELAVFLLDPSHLYSNTPEDFDFKINELSTQLSQSQWIKSMKQLNLVFPIIHGKFGEDGEIQKILESENIPFVGSSSKDCHRMFHKDIANKVLKDAGYPVLPCKLIEKDNWQLMLQQHKKLVIKPQAGGSSIGVNIVSTIKQGLEVLKNSSSKMICEAFCQGFEFTIIVLGSSKGPVALVPIEICIDEKDAFYDYRRKYLPTSNTRWLCPPRFNEKIIRSIQHQAENVFTLFNMQDFVRIDGWLDGDKIIFSDINPISGMEQNSLIFLQASRVGMSHQVLLNYILSHSAKRQGILPPSRMKQSISRQKVAILCGGDTEERQISLMSGTNIWLKLKRSSVYESALYLLCKDKKIWLLPYTYALTHTVEEIYACLQSQDEIVAYMSKVVPFIRKSLGLKDVLITEIYPKVFAVSIENFVHQLLDTDTLFFNALHGGFGEDGSVQAILDHYKIAYNGSGVQSSKLGMDKHAFAVKVNQLAIAQIRSLKKQSLSTWNQHKHMGVIVIKPKSMGCSYGVSKIANEIDFNAYQRDENESYIVEQHIETDDLYYDGSKLKIKRNTGYLELTLVVCEDNHQYQSLLPSVTVASADILSVEEKFQGGTGINITPPPENLISSESLLKLRASFENLSKALNIKDYVRYDFFYHLQSGKIIVIEMNTLPALTPSTVLYHQMLASNYAKSPLHGIEKLIELVQKKQEKLLEDIELY